MVKVLKPRFRHSRFDKESVAIPQAKMLRFFQMIELLTKEHLKTLEISEKLDTHTRTINRYLVILNHMGMLDQDLHGRYFIPQDNCPLCGKYHQQPTTK